MNTTKAGMPRKHEIKGGAQEEFENKKKAQGAKNVGIYLNADTLVALDRWKKLTGLGATQLFNLVMSNSLERPKLFLNLIRFDYEAQLTAIEELASKIRSDDESYDDSNFETDISLEEQLGSELKE